MKLFSKIATALVGMAMAIGVGVAVGSTKVGEVRADSTANFTLSSASDVTVDGVTASFAKGSGSNAPAWYSAGLRLYASNTVTISSSNTLTGVSFNWEKQGSKAFATVTADVGTYTHPSAAGTGTWTGSSTSVVFTLGSSGQLQLNTFSVTYSGGGSTTYTVTYNANEHGTGTMTDPNSPYTSGAEVTVLANAFVADTDYEFVDFNTAADGTGTSYDAGDKFEISANTTLYAQWNYTGVGPDVSLVASSTSDFVSPWSVDNTPSGIEAANRGWQWSSGKSAVITYSTDKSVSKVVVSATTNGSGSLAVTVGGNDFGESTAITSTKTAYTFEGNETGDVVITLTNSGTKSVYADRIEIYFNNLIETKMVDNHNYTITTYQFYDGDPTLVFKYFDNNDQAIDDANWVTSDSSVLKLNPKTSYAYIGPNGLGTATVTASKEGYKPATVTFTVVPNPSQQTLTVYEYDGSSATNPADDTTVLWSSGTGTYRYVATDEDNNIITTANWTSSDPTVATVTSSEGVASVTTVKPGEYSLTATSSGFNSGSAGITVSKSYVENVVVGGSMTKTSYTTSESWSPNGLTATADYHSGWVEDITSQVEWTFSPASPTAGTTSVIPYAHFEGEAYAGSSQSVTVTVQHAGTAEDPFTVVEALAKANEIGTVGKTGQGPWVTKGIISRVTEAPTASYWNATYYISDDGSQTNELQVYRGYYLDNAKFDAETAALLTAGKVVTITGNLTGSYGCEYCQGNYLLSLESPSTGDIDVTFEPELNIEIGDTGTFTASTDATSPTYTWSVEDSSLLSVDSSTGAFEGLKLGTTKVTVNVSATEGNGEASAFITVNGSGTYTIEEANEIAAAEASGSTTSYYIYVEGYVSLFNSDSQTAGNERALDITNYDQNESIMVFVGKSGYSTFISGLKLGDYIRVKAFVQNYSGKYELTTPTKVESYYTEMSFAYELLELTDAVCKDYDGVTDNKSKLETVWETLVDSSHYGALTSEQIENLVDCEASETGTTVQQAMARYDYLVVKYELDNFISDRTPSVGAVTQPTISNNNNINSSMSIIVVAVIAITSLSAIGVLLVIKRRKSI